MTYQIFDDTACELGEGVMWHPRRGTLFWFDIQNGVLFEKGDGAARTWQFDEPVSAAGWIDQRTLLVAGATALRRFDLDSGAGEVLCPLEADNPVTRSNDGRADPWGGFWIGTMGKHLEPGAGAIYRYYRGELRILYTPLTVPNAICFSPDRRFGYFSDTVQARVWRQPLNPVDGWPQGDPEVFLDFTDSAIRPDGAVCDSAGYFVNAQWGAARVARYGPDGRFDREYPLPTDHITCPGFGGTDLRRMFVTSAMQGLGDARLADQPEAGMTFSVKAETAGQPEHQVIP